MTKAPPPLRGARGFLGEGYACTRARDAAVHILPVPYEKTVSYGAGAARGPEAIVRASWNLEAYDIARDRELHRIGIYTHGPVDCQGSEEEVQQRITAQARQLLATGAFPLFLGGEHSITFPLVRACMEHFSDFTLLYLDAHSDLRDTYEGNPLSHACVMRRVRELGVPLVQAGLRSMSVEERGFFDDSGISLFPMRHIRRNADWMTSVAKRCGKTVYLSIDVDALDPSQMPSTGTPEPGGLSWDEVMGLFDELERRGCTLIGADMVELAPIEGLSHPDFLCAKMLYHLVGWKFFPDIVGDGEPQQGAADAGALDALSPRGIVADWPQQGAGKS